MFDRSIDHRDIDSPVSQQTNFGENWEANRCAGAANLRSLMEWLTFTSGLGLKIALINK
jgi:SLT domain-containing protein